MVNQVCRNNSFTVMVHNHLRNITGDEQFIFFKGAVEHVPPFNRLPFEVSVQKLNGADLLSASNKAGVNNARIVYRYYFCFAFNCISELQRSLKPCREKQQHDNADNRGNDRSATCVS